MTHKEHGQDGLLFILAFSKKNKQRQKKTLSRLFWGLRNEGDTGQRATIQTLMSKASVCEFNC